MVQNALVKKSVWNLKNIGQARMRQKDVKARKEY